MWNTVFGEETMGLDPVTKLIIRVVVAAFSYSQQRKAQKRQEAQMRAMRSNVLVNKQSNNDPIYPLYGKQRMGGTRVFIESSDGSGDLGATTHLNLALAMCEGEISEIKQLWFNDTVVWDADNGGTTTSLDSGGYQLEGFTSKYAGSSMTINWYPGTTTQTVDTDLQASVNQQSDSNAEDMLDDIFYVIKSVGTTDFTLYGAPDNTVGTSFQVDLGSPIDATAITSGDRYEIVSTGTQDDPTDYTTIGAADNNPGTRFTATGVGTGTGTVKTAPVGTGTVRSEPWTDDHELKGISYIVLILEANGEIYGGQLPTFTAVLEGKKILDVSTLSDGDTLADMTPSNYVSGADQSPADVMYDYMISREFGKGLDRNDQEEWIAGLNIDLASFQQAKLDCAAAREGDGFNINGFLQSEKQIFDNIGEIMETCNGMMLFVDGKYQLRIKKPNEQLNLPDSSVFTKDTIIGDIQLSLPDKSQLLNKATGVFNNPLTKYNDDLVIYKVDDYVEADNGSVLETREDYTLITDEDLVLDLITQQVEISRGEYKIQFEAAHTALLLRSGDIIEIRLDDFGWGTGAEQEQKFWRVQELKLTEDNTVEITASLYDSSKEL